MAIHDLFSKRQKRLRGEFPDVYQYEELSEKLRVQIIYIITEIFETLNARGADTSVYDDINFPIPKSPFKFIHSILAKENGSFKLTNDQNDAKAVFNYLLKEKSTEKVLDVVELCFQVINTNIRNNPTCQWRDDLHPKFDEAISDLNSRFNEHGVGYSFCNNQLIRIDSQFIHSEAVKPVLILLANDPYYEGANQEFLKAHEHYRHKRYKECLVECCKSFESLMKAICEKRKWDYKPTDTASKLIKTCFEHKLIPCYMDNQIASLKQILESGVPTIRNKEGGHGQGAEIVEVSEHLASYCLHLTASNLLFLANCEKQLP